MALGGWVSVFGVNFSNRVDIRNFHECYPLVLVYLLFQKDTKHFLEQLKFDNPELR